jgi:hypothetical protein
MRRLASVSCGHVQKMASSCSAAGIVAHPRRLGGENDKVIVRSGFEE